MVGAVDVACTVNRLEALEKELGQLILPPPVRVLVVLTVITSPTLSVPAGMDSDQFVAAEVEVVMETLGLCSTALIKSTTVVLTLEAVAATVPAIVAKFVGTSDQVVDVALVKEALSYVTLVMVTTSAFTPGFCPFLKHNWFDRSDSQPATVPDVLSGMAVA
jgi:hypothetical protein